MRSLSDSQYEDVTINSVAGLTQFLDNVKTIYEDAKAICSKSKNLETHSRTLESFYNSLRSRIENLRRRIESGEEMLEIDAIALQNKYDSLVSLHAEIKSTPIVLNKQPAPVKGKNKPVKSNSRKLQQQNNQKKPPTLTIAERIEQLQLTYKKMLHLHEEASVAESILLDEARETYDHIVSLKQELNDTFDNKKVEAFLRNAEAHMFEIRNALKEIARTRPSIDRTSKRMDINAGDVEVAVPIRTDKATKPPERISFVPSSITTQPKQNPVKRNVPKELVALPRTDESHEKQSLTAKYLTAPKYQNFITENFSSIGGFERILDSTVTKIESETIDGIERWLGEIPASAFEYIKDMSVEELLTFAASGYDNIYSQLQKENIKYETFLAWVDVLEVMLDTLNPPSAVSFGELFARFMIESEMSTREAN